MFIDGRTTKVESDMAIIVPAGARHNIRNTGERPLQLYTLYAPPEHEDGTVQVINRMQRHQASTSRA